MRQATRAVSFGERVDFEVATWTKGFADLSLKWRHVNHSHEYAAVGRPR